MGTTSTDDLTGLGGPLENDQPLPIGAAKLTTDLTNAAKAEVGVIDGYGMPGDILDSFELFYSYLKADDGTANPSAAPSIKLTFFNPDCDDPVSGGDCFGTLVYEPTWNQGPVGSVAVPLDQWIDVAIDAENGLFWWTGGFGPPNRWRSATEHSG